jgi:pyruvate dehydrogenase E2 component (dihydrolipoamide acetyltransferase)
VPISGIRKVIADRMALSHADIPGVHVVEECDVTNLVLGKVVAVAAAAMGSMVARHPYFNAHVVGSEIICYERCDVAVAVDTPQGLMVPVLRDVANRDVEDLHADVQRLAELARVGRLRPQDMAGATTTLTSPGKRGGVLATPLIAHPQTLIVGVHRATKRAVVIDDEVVVRRIANVTITFDHRVIDGAAAGDYALELCRLIEGFAPGPAAG